MLRDQRIIIVGATGRVGREMLKILWDKGVPTNRISAAASAKSEGIKLLYGKDQLTVLDLAKVDFSKYDVAFFSAGGAISKQYVPLAASLKCLVIDNTSFCRMNSDVSLIVPEINLGDYQKFSNKYVIANPNCSTIQMVMALKPLLDEFGLERVDVSTYQAVSGAGQKGVEELLSQIKNPSFAPCHFKKTIAFNVIPQIDVFCDSLYTKEEEKMMNETKKILNVSELIITATCVRVPVITGHSVSVVASFKKEVDLKQAREVLAQFPGIKVVDNPQDCLYCTPLEAVGRDEVFVSRLRKHPDLPNVLSLWVVSDNLRKGAALNSIQIAERIFA